MTNPTNDLDAWVDSFRTSLLPPPKGVSLKEWEQQQKIEFLSARIDWLESGRESDKELSEAGDRVVDAISDLQDAVVTAVGDLERRVQQLEAMLQSGSPAPAGKRNGKGKTTPVPVPDSIIDYRENLWALIVGETEDLIPGGKRARKVRFAAEQNLSQSEFLRWFSRAPAKKQIPHGCQQDLNIRFAIDRKLDEFARKRRELAKKSRGN